MADIPRDIRPLLPQPGVKRDGTIFEGNNWVDAQWTRWQRGRPRKMGGYRQVNDQFSGIIRGGYIHVNNGLANIYGGGSDNLEVVQADASTGDGAGIVDRTPSGFAASANNVWQFSGVYDSVSAATTVLAHAGQNLTNIDSNVQTPVYYGSAMSVAALT